MIYTVPIAQITWDDIDAFCQQQRTEDSYLDYKREFPANLENTIAAMANTVGGLILIGVEEDTDNRPKRPMAGIPSTRGLEEKVMNIILGNIMPPVFPEIQVCRNASDDRAIVVIRIQQSEQAPHAVANNTRVYLRTGNVNKPEDLVQIDQIDWLRNRREKSENLRKSLFARAEARVGRRDKPFRCPLLTLAISPMYPNKPLIDPPGLYGLRRKIAAQFQGRSVPEPDYKGGAFTHESLVIEDADKPYSTYTEMSVFGLYFTQDCLLNEPTKENDPENRMYLADILVKMFLWLTSGDKLYSHLGACPSNVHFGLDSQRALWFLGAWLKHSNPGISIKWYCFLHPYRNWCPQGIWRTLCGIWFASRWMCRRF